MTDTEEYRGIKKGTFAIVVKNISIQWQGQNTLNNISFTLQPGQNLLVAGPSGSGKTLLAKALAGQVFYAGTVSFAQDRQECKPSILFVGQHYHFKNLSNVNGFYYQQRFNSMDADDALTVAQELEKSGSPAEKIEGLLEAFDLSYRKESPLLHLSSGEHKRLQMIKALLQEPDILILDEPFTGLDIKSRKKLQVAIDAMAANGTRFILICSIADAPQCISHYAILEQGRLDRLIPKDDFVPASKTALAHTKTLPVQAIQAHFFNAVIFKNVSVTYGSKRILNNINWQVARGDKWLLKGANGAGKSTLLSLITGDNPQAYANDIILFDQKRGSGESIWDIKKNIGYVSPELQWYFDRETTCYKAVASGLFDTIGLFRPLNQQQKDTVGQWLEYLGIATHAGKLLGMLPMGIQRLVLLARAMVKNPPLLILDEPCQGLDQQQKEGFINVINTLCANNERTLIYVSHYIDELPDGIDKIIELDKGTALFYTRTN